MRPLRAGAYLVHKNDKSEKFWSIDAEGTTYTIYEGTPDKVKKTTKSFEYPEKCMEEVQKLIDKKLKTGYKHNDAPESREQEAWDQWNNR